MNKIPHSYKILLHGNSGSAIVIAMMVLLIVTIIGISTIDNSITEKTIATNEILHQQAFYEADGATELTQKLIEANIDTYTGFTQTVYKDASNKDFITVKIKNFWANPELPDDPLKSDLTRTPEYKYPDHYPDFSITTDDGKTDIKTGSITKMSKGGAIMMAAGYEGKGKSGSLSGIQILYKIHSQNIRDRNAASTVLVEWRYVP